MTRSRATVAAFAVLAVVAGLPAASPAVAQTVPAEGGITLESLSNRADLVSGGDALLSVGDLAPDDLRRLHVDVDGKDVTAAFLDGGGTGLVEDLEVGENVVTARLGRGEGESLTVTNHPIEGPIFSGPSLQPWLCTTEAHGLEAATDAGCNAPAVYSYFYKSTSGGALAPYDPTAAPDDVATITVDDEQVPYVVRRERGTMNRGVYDVAGLWDPAAGEDAATWNGKLLYAFGASSGTVHSQGAPSALQNVLVDHALSSGYMVATNTLNTRGHSGNPVVSAESTMMLKEHIVETYGPILFTLGQGLSGGAIGQQMVANDYPGLLDGIQPGLSFPDGTSTKMEIADCINLNRYYAANAEQWSPEDRAAVNGNLDARACTSWQSSFGGLLDPVGGCGPAVDGTPLAYDPETNRDGIRCAGQDYEKNIWGVDADNIANSPYSNVGLQYGLEALIAGDITPAQFADLNAEIGAFDDDYITQPSRAEADPFALETAYRAGQVNDFSQADKVAILDLRPPDNSGIHTDYHSDEVRARLIAANGHADNQVIWRFPDRAALAGFTVEAFRTMDDWLTGIKADTRAVDVERKVRDNKPAAAVDACFPAGVKTTDPTVCATTNPVYEFPRIAAGGPATHDVLACQLQPLDRTAYEGVVFTDDEWTRLQAVFADGVCDFDEPGRGFQPSVPWLSFMAGPGGQPIGAEPVAVAVPALGARFSDVPVGSQYFDDIEFLAERGITEGFPDGTFRPADRVSRGQMSLFLYRSAGLPAFTVPATPTFTDVPSSDVDLYRAVEWMAAEGITLGSTAPDGSRVYRPMDRVARGQMAAFLYRFAGEPEFDAPSEPTFPDVAASEEFYVPIEWAASVGVTEGFPDGTFRWMDRVSRAQMAAFLNRFAGALQPS